MQAPAALTITQRYRDQGTFTNMLTRIGVTVNAHRKLIDDDFTNMEVLVTNYSSNINSFESYLKGINKTFGNAPQNTAINNNVNLSGCTPYEQVMGYIPDISELVEFEWYQWVWYSDPVSPSRTLLGRWLGPAHNAGQGLAYYILNENGEVVMRSTVVPPRNEELTQASIQERQKSFSEHIEKSIGNHSKAAIGMTTQKPEDDKDIYHSLFFDVDDHSEDLLVQEFDPDDLPVLMPYHDDISGLDAPCAELNDNLIGSNVAIPGPDGDTHVTVKRRKVNHDTNLLLGSNHSNPLLDTRVYEVELPDGTYYNNYSANVLIKNIMANADDNGQTALMLEDIIGHRFNDDCVHETDRWYETSQGSRKHRITTKGCDINMLWKDGTSSWIPLKDMKESNPIEVAEYVAHCDLASHLVFSWWVPRTLKHKQKIIKQVTH